MAQFSFNELTQGSPYGGYYDRARFLEQIFNQQRQEQEQAAQLFELQKQREAQAQRMADLQYRSGMRDYLNKAMAQGRPKIGFTERYTNGILERTPIFNAKFQPAGLAETDDGRFDRELDFRREQLNENRRQFDLSRGFR